jgi:hypothetical protein
VLNRPSRFDCERVIAWVVERLLPSSAHQSGPVHQERRPLRRCGARPPPLCSPLARRRRSLRRQPGGHRPSQAGVVSSWRRSVGLAGPERARGPEGLERPNRLAVSSTVGGTPGDRRSLGAIRGSVPVSCRTRARLPETSARRQGRMRGPFPPTARSWEGRAGGRNLSREGHPDLVDSQRAAARAARRCPRDADMRDCRRERARPPPSWPATRRTGALRPRVRAGPARGGGGSVLALRARLQPGRRAEGRGAIGTA